MLESRSLMMKTNRISLLLVFSACALASCGQTKKPKRKSSTDVPTSAIDPTSGIQPTTTGTSQSWDNYDNYYNGYKMKDMFGPECQFEMHKYFIDQHKTYVKYDQYWSYGTVGTDLDPETNKRELFYTAKQVHKSNNSGLSLNREHVWPCANSSDLWYRDSPFTEHKIDTNANYWGGGSDLFHIRPAYGPVNSARSNALFYTFSDEEKASGNLKQTGESGGAYKIWTDSKPSKVEVDPYFLGDVARIIAYIFIHYSAYGDYNVYYSANYTPVYSLAEAVKASTTHSPYVCGTLNLTDILAYGSEAECRQKLIEWNRIDPPSKVEKNRNDYVQSVQGNRNPFIDFPQLMELAFDF